MNILHKAVTAFAVGTLLALGSAAAAELAKLEKAGATAWTGTRDAFAAAYKDLTESSDKAAKK
jgi:hypothetical protein